jgi:16S rRNA (uracil1498-N3)-methyltransferase
MSLPVYLVSSLNGVVVGDVVDVTGDEAHHAVAVRRSRVGESVVLTDGRGGQATGLITATGRRLMQVRIGEVLQTIEPTPALWIAQAIPKGERGERAVEVLTEIGVARIFPWAAERSVGQWRGERADKALAKWRSTARESGKQARRTWAVEVAPLLQTADLLALVAEVDLAIVLHEGAAGPLAHVPVPSQGTILIIVGPEGGITEPEVESLTTAGAAPVRLGTEILRTSTAGVVACAGVLSRTPRWRVP